MRNRIIIIILMIAITAMVGFSVYLVNKGKNSSLQKEEETNEVEKTSSDALGNEDIMRFEDIDLNNHEMQSSSEFEGYRKATDSDKSKYEITNVKKSSNSKYTSITGSIKNKGGSESLILKAEFKGDTNSSSSIEIKNLKINKTEDFEIRILNNVAADDYSVFVEYVGE